MRARTAATAAAVALACGAPQALAAAKPVCLLVVDAAGDGTSAGVVPNRDSLDIRSADVATGARNLVGVVRLGATDLDPTLATGATYTLSWRAGTVEQAFVLVRYADGSRRAVFDPNTAFGASGDEVEAALVVDTATDALVWSVPRKANPALAKKGAKLSGLTVTADPASNIGANQGGVSFSLNADNGLDGDEASSGKTYTDRTPSCVKGV